ncbi:MAG: hypothetical protein A2521_09455 [Deltaproteobacteria bacterium RIFOXYD12_FULL_57_12]|nr:MAG: hypothetical protein A2521_09455 [Deltaproteobacteria bacterium RIFOXYD12_FULL_57_12]
MDKARSIDILHLVRKGVLAKGSTSSWTSSWTQNGKVIASISYRVEASEVGPSGLRFMYTITDNDTGKKKDYNYIIPVVSTPCNYGEKRWWFICPLVVNGRSCQRRCRIVYMPTGSEYFGCRECHRLTYESRQRHREKFYEGFEKPYKAAETFRKELARVRSWKKKEKLWRQLSRAHAAIESFEKILTNRTPKIIYKEK